MQDKVGDKFDSLDDVGMLEVANISLELEVEVVVFTNDGGDDGQGYGDDDLVKEMAIVMMTRFLH